MGCRNSSLKSIALQVKQLVPPVSSDGHKNQSWVFRLPNRISLHLILFLGSSKWSNAFNLKENQLIFFSFSLTATLHCTDPLKKIVKKWEKVHKKFVFVFNPFLVIHSITIHYLILYARGFDGKTPNFTKTISSNQDVCKYTISFILAC